MATPEPEVVARVARILGWTPESWRSVQGGYTPTARYALSGPGGTAFAKVATTPVTVDMLRREIAAYRSISGNFVPRLYGFDESGPPILVIEDLSRATWPPPWTTDQVDRVLEAIEAMHATTADLPSGTLLDRRDAGWPGVAANPEPFLSLGLATPEWLEGALLTLIVAEQSCNLIGSALTHLDLRSDNLCLTADGVKFVDWAEARLSDPRVDLAFFLPSLAFEGGPVPEDILPDAPDAAALVSGFFALRAGLPDIPGAPFVRRVQREQLAAALPWAVRALRLPPPLGA